MRNLLVRKLLDRATYRHVGFYLIREDPGVSLLINETEVISMSITIKPVEKPAMSKVAGAVLCG